MAEPLPSLVVGPVTEVVDAENPWPGLASFEERYESFFHGREREERALVRRVLRQRVTVLTGRSGMGKTSLLRAGLFPKLRREGIFPVSIRFDFKDSSSSPTQQIFDAILNQAKNPDQPVEAPHPLPGESVWEYLHRSDADFWSRDNLLLTPLLVFDQFEDVFLALRGQPSELTKRVEDFLIELADLVAGRVPEALADRWKSYPEASKRIDRDRHNYKILLSLREDFWADLDDWSEEYLASGLGNRLRLMPMNGERALEAVLKPAERQSLVDQDVAVQIVRWVAGSGAGKPADDSVPLDRLTVEPALLSLVCRELNNRRLERKERKITADVLKKGQATIIEDFYTRCMTDVQPSVRVWAEEELLLPEGRRDTAALPEDLQKDPAFLSDLRKLQDRRLLRIETREGVERVELTHDVLAPAVRASRDARRQHEREVEEWNQKIADAKKEGRGMLITSIVVGVVAIGAWLLIAKQEAQVAATTAVVERDKTAGEKRDTDHLLALADLRAGTGLVEEGRAAEALAFLARAVQKTSQAPAVPPAKASAVPPAEALTPDPLGLAVRSAILEQLLRRNWPLAEGDLPFEGQIQTISFDSEGRLLAVTSSDQSSSEQGLWLRMKELDPAGSIQKVSLPFPAPVESASLSPDGRRLVVATADGQCQLWDVGTQHPVGGIVQVGEPLEQVILAPNGRTALALLDKGRLRLWDLEAGRALSPLRRQSKVAKQFRAAEFSRDGRYFVTATDDFTAQVWAASSGAPVGKPLLHRGVVLSARFGPDGRRVVTASADGTARVWETRTGRPVGAPLRHRDVVRWAELSPKDKDGRIVATASWDYTARLWDAASGKPIGEEMRHRGRIQSVQFSPDGRFVITASSDGTARIWDAQSGCPTHEPLNVWQALAFAGFSPDGRHVFTQSDTRLRLWDVEPTRAREAVLQPDRQAVVPGPEFICRPSLGRESSGRPEVIQNVTPLPGAAARLSRQGNLLAVARERKVRLYKLRLYQWGTDRTLTTVPTVFALEGEVAAVALSPDGSRLAAAWNWGSTAEGSPDSGKVRVWDTATGRTLADPPLKGPFSSLDFDPAGERLAIAWWNGRVDLWTDGDLSPAPLKDKAQRGKNEHLAAIRFSQDGKKLAAAYWDYTAQQWNLGSGEAMFPMKHQGRVFSVEFSPDGTRLVTATSNGMARETLANSKEALSYMVHPYSVWTAEFGPETSDVRRIVTVAADGRVRIWEPTSGQIIGVLDLPKPAISAQFLPDGQTLVTVSNDGSVRLWDTPTASPADSSELAELAEVVSGFQVNKRGIAAYRPSLMDKLAELRRSAKGDSEGQAPASALVRWFFADRGHRTYSPLQSISPAK